MFKRIIKKLNRNKENISTAEMLEILKTNDNVILLDVRSSQEYREGNLPGSINIPLYEIQKRANMELKNKDAIIIAYCSAGTRSKKAIKILRKLGYKNLYTVEGGINIYEWDTRKSKTKYDTKRTKFK